MLIHLGRGLSPVQARAIASAPATFAALTLTASLPAALTYARADSAATYRDSSGILRQSSADAPRFNHSPAGTPLGLWFEGARENKIAAYNASPANTSALSVASGTPVLSVVDDSAALAAAGLADIGNAMVYKIDNSGGGTNCDVDVATATLNSTAPHSFSIWARTQSGGNARLKRSGSASGTALFTHTNYQRVALENETPSATSNDMRLNLSIGTILYFILMQVEEGSFASSEIITAGAAAARAQDALTLTELGGFALWNESEGHLAVRYRPARDTGADQYLLAAHDGSTANMLGLRIKASDFMLQANVRAGGVSKHAGSNGIRHTAGVPATAGLSWASGESLLLGGGKAGSATYSGDPSGLTTLHIGARSGGSEGFWGHVSAIEIGLVQRSAAGLGARLYGAGDTRVAGGGQSLMRGHFTSQETGAQTGRQTFLGQIGLVRPLDAPVFADGSTGGTAAAASSGGSYWWDNDLSARGPAFDTFYANLAAAGLTPQAVIWAQGEADSHQIPGLTSRAQYKAALTAIFADIRATLGDIPILIQRIGRRTAGYSNTGGIQTVREVQQEMIDENAWCHHAAETYDLPLYTGDGANVHLTDAGYVTASIRNARAVLAALGEAVSGASGPRITGAARSGTTVTVTLAHDAGTDFGPASGIEGFVFHDDGAPIAITAAVRTGPTTISLSLASPPAGIERLYYVYDDAATLNPVNVIKDNSDIALPLINAALTL